MNTVSSTDNNAYSVTKASSLETIYLAKRKRYTKTTLISLAVLMVPITILAFLQNIIIREVINLTVLLMLLFSLYVVSTSQATKVWPTHLALFFLHVIATSGTITNGGLLSYAVSSLPVLPLITGILLGRRAALYSCLYAVLLVLALGGLLFFGIAPENLTPEQNRTVLATFILLICVLAAYSTFAALSEATQQAEQQVRDYITTMEHEIQQRKQAEENLLKANSARSQFLSTISHELRTPLNGVIGFNQLLKKQTLDDKARNIAQRMGDASQVLLDKINRLLEFTDLSSGDHSCEPKPFALNELVHWLEGNVPEYYREHNNQLSFEFTAVEDCIVVSDMAKIGNILLALIDNALKFCNNGTIRVLAEVSNEHNQTAVLNFKVVDTGPGIDEEHFDDLFTACTQADMSTRRSYEGIGLGLAISLQYAALLDGTIEAKNDPSGGCTFILTVPARLYSPPSCN
ncbi:hypothetical protein OLMES_0229 [Oleiphilus messinensis]|uniref:histidine kinase n=1 Tax=Oleiphilus messinensis TaxID=141451 RepID=A0A1Y0I483_9GAMM|nr:ATP-binding protein [Oleiphilus messinensis]ARU54335.1 hypothetical protein OLMES_0229 [Oleiphilus messinensis]